MSPWIQTCSYEHTMHMYTVVTMYMSTIVREIAKTIHHLSGPGPYQAQTCLQLYVYTYKSTRIGGTCCVSWTMYHFVICVVSLMTTTNTVMIRLILKHNYNNACIQLQ